MQGVRSLALDLSIISDQNLSDREKLKKLRDLKKNLISDVRELEKERNEYRTERDELNQKVKTLISEAREHRKQRDIVNEDVKLNKALRDIRQEDADKVLSELEKLEEKVKDQGIDIKRAQRGHKRILREIRDLEMKIQTTPNLTPQKEREMMDEIETLYKKMEELEVAEELKDEIKAIRKRHRTLRSEALTHHKEVQKLANQSQEHHEIMLAKLAEAKEIRAEADNKHKLVIEMNDKIRKLRKEINQVAVEADRLRKKLGEETVSERKKRKIEEAKAREKVITDKAEEILQRYQDGEKIGFEDFKLLISRGLLND